MNFFVTGSDTEVGKTYTTALLLRNLRNRNIDVVGMKPIETGEGTDAQCLHDAMEGCVALQTISPVRLSAALAPATAAEQEGKIICTEKIFASYRQLSAQHALVLVEGAGGWRVPIASGYDMADLAVDLSKIAPLQVIVVALNRLGVINHTLLTLESICARGLVCAGFILNQGTCPVSYPSISSNAQWITHGSDVPFWFEVNTGQTILPEAVFQDVVLRYL